MNIAKLKQHPRVFARLFGIEPDKFDVLVERVHPLWVRAEALRLRHPRKIKKGSGRPYALTLIPVPMRQWIAWSCGTLRSC